MDKSESSLRADGRESLEDVASSIWRVITLDESEPHKFDWGSIQWLCSGMLFADAQQTFGFVQILPGQKNPLHLHPNSDEMLFLLEGELDHSIDDQIYHLTPGTAIHIPQGAQHDARNPGDQVARMIVTYPTADREIVMSEEGQE